MDSQAGSAHGPAHTGDVSSTGFESSNSIRGLVYVLPWAFWPMATSGALSNFGVWLCLGIAPLGMMCQTL